MNLLDATVKEVLSDPYEKYNVWWVKVMATCWSDTPNEKELYFKTKEEALAVKPGWEFLT